MSGSRWRPVLPSLCLLCGGTSDRRLSLCRACAAALPTHTPACPRCAHHLPPGSDPDRLCGACLKAPPPQDRSFAAFRYQSALPALVAGLKFGHQLSHGAVLGELLAQALVERRPASPWPGAILPVPLHPRRLAERGFNQALELARPLAARLDIPLRPRAVERILNTPEQSRLSEAERQRNLKRAFQVREDLPDHVAIVDDVITTGSTVATLAAMLRSAGVSRIEVWAVAKTFHRRGG